MACSRSSPPFGDICLKNFQTSASNNRGDNALPADSAAHFRVHKAVLACPCKAFRCLSGQYIAVCRGEARLYAWILVNGFWSLFLAFGLTLTSLLTRTAHSWRFGNVLCRQLIADYGAPLMVCCACTPKAPVNYAPQPRGALIAYLAWLVQSHQDTSGYVVPVQCSGYVWIFKMIQFLLSCQGVLCELHI